MVDYSSRFISFIQPSPLLSAHSVYLFLFYLILSLLRGFSSGSWYPTGLAHILQAKKALAARISRRIPLMISMNATELGRWKRFAAKGGIGRCTAVTDCVAEDAEDLMFYQDDVITVLMKIEGEEGRFMGFCEGVVGRFSASDVRFHGPLKKPVATKRSTSSQSSQSFPSTSSGFPFAPTTPSNIIESLPELTSSPSEFAQTVGASPSSSKAEHSGPPTSTLSRSSSLHVATNPTPISHEYEHPSTSLQSTSSPTTTSSAEGLDAQLATRSSIASAPDSSVPHTPGDFPENERRLSKDADTSKIVMKGDDDASDSDLPESSSHRRNATVTGVDLDHRLSSIATSEAKSKDVRSSVASGSSSNSAESRSRPLYAQYDSSEEEIEGNVTAPSDYDSGNMSDGGFGIGMQFIQGLIDDNRVSNATMSVVGDSSALGLSSARSRRRRSSTASSTEWSEEGVAKPAWRRSSPVEEFTGGGLAALGRAQSNASKSSKRRASSRASKKSKARSEEDIEADDADAEGVSKGLGKRKSARGSRVSSRKSSIRRDTVQSAKPLRRSISAKSLISNAVRPISPSSQRSLRPRSIASLRSNSRPFADPDLDTNSLRSGSVSLSNTNTRSSGSHNNRHLSQSTTHGNHFVFDTDYDPLPPPPPRATDPRPSLEVQSSSESDAEGYYEEYGDIYDEYRYSRYSVFSKKSRKSVLPPPSKMPTSDSFVGSLPLPSSSSGFLSNNNVATPPRSKLVLNTGADDDAEERSLHSSPISMSAVPRVLNFGRVDDMGRKGSSGGVDSDDGGDVDKTMTLEPSLMTTSPVVGNSQAAQFASSLRTRIDSEGSRYDDKELGGAEGINRAEDVGEQDESSGSPSDSPVMEPSFVEKVSTAPLRIGHATPRQPGSIPPPLILTPSADYSASSEMRPPLSPQEVALLALEGRSPRSSTVGASLVPPSPATPGDLSSGVAKDPPSTEAPYLTPTGRPLTFLPHPGAPMPRSPSQPSIHAPPPAYSPPVKGPPAKNALFSTMAMAAAHSRLVKTTGGLGRLATIHGRTVVDLGSAAGPVMINWFVDADGRGKIPPMPKPSPASAQAPSFQRSQTGAAPHHPQHAFSLPTTSREHQPHSMNPDGGMRSPIHRKGSTTGDGTGDGQVLTMPTRPSDMVPTPRSATMDTGSAPGTPIPRANFFPKTGQPRPRSRSFNGVTAPLDDIPVSIENTDGPKDAPPVFSVPPLRPMRSQQGPLATSEQSKKPSVAPLDVSSLPGRSPKPPSPLALTHGATASSPSLKSPPPSPLIKLPLSPNSLTQANSPLSNIRSIRPTPSVSSLPGPNHAPGSSVSSFSSPRLAVRNVASASGLRTEVKRIPLPQQANISAGNSPSLLQRNITPSEDMEGSTPPSKSTALMEDGSPNLMTGSIGRSASLRSKISLSALKSKAGKGSKDVSELGLTTSNIGSPSTPSTQYEFTEETVQVKEGGAATEFELIRPVMGRVSLMRASEDSGSPIDQTSSIITRDRLSIASEVTKTDGDSYRSASPVVSARGGKQPTIMEGVEPELEAIPRPASPTDPALVQAHRARELKWITTMGNTPASSAKKNKKIKKLVQDGVPPSVRSVVWLYLTDTKSRRMDGLYTALCARGAVNASPDIERDVERTFCQHPHLRDPKGPIVSLLQAYLHMVPDVKYQRGLAVIAGTILLQSPEEDAFWTFLALMDNHLRGYFAHSTTQMEVDAQLFMKAVETADPALAKRLFAGLGVRSIELCQIWFTSLFAEALPPKYLYRVWDLFICEGVIFLFRVGLSILLACRKPIMETRLMTGSDALNYLATPPSSVFSADPDAFIGTALGVKIKEDDLRKSKVKIETTLRQNQQAQSSRPSIAGREFRTLRRPSS